MNEYKKTHKPANIPVRQLAAGKGAVQLQDNRPKTVMQQKPAEPAIQRKADNTGLPGNLKSGVENLSGYSMDDVKVHYNSAKPAQLQALAYAQGTDIHVAPGQEKYLPHEAWHVVQQKQGRVQPTTQMKGGVNVNDDKELEKEADVMGSKASATTNDLTVLRKAKNNPSIVQKGGGMSKSAESESYARVNLLNKSSENPMGHSSLDIVHDGKVTHIDTGLSQSDYARVTEDPIKAMQGKTGAKFTVAVSEGDALSKSTSSVKIELAPEKAEAIIQKAKKIDGRTEAWNANRNCTTPVKELLGMRQGRIFNSPSGTLVQAYVKRYPKAVGFLAATGGLAAYFAYSKYSRDKKDE